MMRTTTHTRKSKPVESERLGLVCPRCECQHFRVVYLARKPGGVLMRLRECRHCMRRVITRERIGG
jgi:hypothetical protein